MAFERLRESGLLGIPLIAALLACGMPEGGRNVNQKSPGDQPGGVELAVGDIAVAPTGSYLLFERDDELAVAWPSNGEIARLGVEQPTRLAFSKTRPVVYVGEDVVFDRLVAVDVVAGERLWSTDVATADFRIVSSADDRHIVIAHDRTVQVIDAQTGLVERTNRFDRNVVDVHILPDDQRALVVTNHVWLGTGDDEAPSTEVAILDLDGGGTRRFDVPNCADEIAITPGGLRAFLAPTTCTDPFDLNFEITVGIDIDFRGQGSDRGYDPVSLIDLNPDAEAFVRNLPGFGPVAMAPDGITAVAFVDNQIIDRSLFDDIADADRLEADPDRYHLMVIDSDALTYEFAAVGEALPRYAMTPSGELLLVDSAFSDAQVRLFDTLTLRFRRVQGAVVQLDNFTINSVSSRAYALDGGLFEIDLDQATSRMMRTDFLPSNINISPNDATLFLRKTAQEICVYDIASEKCQESVRLDVDWD